MLYLISKYRQMKRVFLLISLLILCFNLSGVYAQKKYKPDYKAIARELVGEATTNEEKAKAIYQHLCSTIAYDVDLKIFTPEECYAEKKGTCQAYAQLFAELCKAVKVKCTYISCVTKDESYNKQLETSNTTHGYLMVEGDNKEIFFVDPTWGAGHVENGQFIRKKGDMSWFKVEPEWMIFSHFPADPKSQHLNKPLTKEEFLSMPALNPYLKYFGFDGKKLLEDFRAKTITSMPEVIYHPDNIDKFTIVDVPLKEALNIGETYKFTIKKKNDINYVLVHNKNSFNNWVEEGDNLTMSYIPDAPGRVFIGFQNAVQSEKGIYELLSYQVPTPSPEKYKELVEIDPYYSPVIQALPNFSLQVKQFSFNGKKIIEGAENKSITSLPKNYANKFSEFKIVDVPYNEHLKVGTEYRFMINIPQDLIPALIFNEDADEEWNTIGDTMREIVFTPDKSGTVSINLLRRGEERYTRILEYIVDEPTEKEWEVLIGTHPYLSKELRAFKGFKPDLQLLKVDGHLLINGIGNQSITELPTAQYYKDYPVRAINIPLDKTLMIDSTYTFSVVVPGKGTPILRLNNQNVSEPFIETGGVWEIQYTPTSQGELMVSIFDDQASQRCNILTYNVTEPFRTKKMLIEDCLKFLARQRNVIMAAIGQDDGLPKLHSLPVLKFTDEYLYFAISPGEEIYWQLEKRPHTELMKVDAEESMHIAGTVSFDVPQHVAKEIYDSSDELRMTVDDFSKLKYFSVKFDEIKHHRETPINTK
jgi:Uncharacterized protein involved in cytokinesis, contains TGc (transglutaminase/protease-like) domain